MSAERYSFLIADWMGIRNRLHTLHPLTSRGRDPLPSVQHQSWSGHFEAELNLLSPLGTDTMLSQMYS